MYYISLYQKLYCSMSMHACSTIDYPCLWTCKYIPIPLYEIAGAHQCTILYHMYLHVICFVKWYLIYPMNYIYYCIKDWLHIDYTFTFVSPWCVYTYQTIHTIKCYITMKICFKIRYMCHKMKRKITIDYHDFWNTCGWLDSTNAICRSNSSWARLMSCLVFAKILSWVLASSSRREVSM